MGKLSGKVAIVTGSAQGHGESAARLFAAEGARVVVTDVVDDLGAAVAADLGDAAVYRHLDVSDEAGWQQVVDDTVARWGGLHVLVNNAGILEFGGLLDITADDYLRMVRVNQLGVFLGMRAVARPMMASGGGSIVNIASVDALRGLNGVFAYSSTKWAVRGMSRCAAMELGHGGIRVNVVLPGGMDSPMNADHKDDFDLDRIFGALPIPRLGQPDEIARLTAFLASDDSSYCTGADFVADGGWTAGVRERNLPGLY